MSRQLIIFVATLFAGGTIASAQTDIDESEARNRYTTIHTVIRVGADVDQFLDEADKRYWSRPAEESLAKVMDDSAEDTAATDLEPIDLASIDLDMLDLQGLYPESESALTSADWLADSEFSTWYETQPEILLSLGHLELGQAPELGQATLTAAESTLAVSDLTQNATRFSTQDVISPWDSNAFAESLDIYNFPQQSIAAAPPIVAATVPAASTAENAGLWFFVGLMIAPFAWLGWQEYQDLQNRSRRRATREEEIHSETMEKFEGELHDLDIEVAEREEDEEFVFTEIAAAAEDDCEYELGVLDDANSLLATAGHARRESADPPRREPETKVKNDRLSGESRGQELTMLRGVGPATSAYLARNGIRTLSDVEAAGADRIQEILDQAGSKFRTARPNDWVEQARDLLVTAR